MAAPARKRLLYTVAGIVALAIVLVVAAGLVFEATFRPRPDPEVDVRVGLWGVHNPRYIKKLLADSIASVSAYLAAHPFEGE